MIAPIRAELLKMRSTRTTIGVILGMIVLILSAGSGESAQILLITVLTGLLTHPGGLASREDQLQLLSVGSTAGVFSALAGVLLVTSEYRFGTIRPTILFQPVRSSVLASSSSPARWPASHSESLARRSAGRSGSAILEGRGINVVLSSGDILLLTLGGLAGAPPYGER